ncbi:hypothetical protein ACFLQ2_02300 [archaeon]
MVVFAALIVFFASLPSVNVPSYDSVQAMKVIHDMGEEQTIKPPPGYNTTGCEGKTTAMLDYYNETLEVCMT